MIQLRTLSALSLLSLLSAAPLMAQAATEKTRNPAIIPADRGNADWWMPRHEKVLEEVAKNQYQLIFIGDSITHGFESGGKKVWNQYYAKRQALNLGFSGDQTQHVLWRLQNGELENQQDAKLAVVMIGTNNAAGFKPEQTADGITAIVDLLKADLPKAKILLLAIFPRGESPDDKLRQVNDKVNARIAKLADQKRVFYLDIASAFLDENGILPKDVMSDLLHPTGKGYQLWAEAIEPKIQELGL